MKNLMRMDIGLAILLGLGMLAGQGCGEAAANGNSAMGEVGNGKGREEIVADPEAESYLHGKEFDEYWYQGQAEINAFELEQARYGEMRKGDAVLVFVTEDLYLDRQVKADQKNAAYTPILKMNFTKDFVTGVYPYHMMMSVFSPTDVGKFPRSLKVATASQEWCGHTFTQLNLRGSKYNYIEHSYFESEGDSEQKIDAVWLEDELWTRIRLAPETLPEGEVKMIPASFASRLRHQALKPEKALVQLHDAQWEGRLARRLEVNYPEGGRSLAIIFGLKFPYEIFGWEETYKSGWGEKAKTLTTKARRKSMKMLDYWNLNSNDDQSLRKDLGLE